MNDDVEPYLKGYKEGYLEGRKQSNVFELIRKILILLSEATITIAFLYVIVKALVTG